MSVREVMGGANEPLLLRELGIKDSGAVNSVRFTRDGAYCMTASDDRTIRLWNPHRDDPSKQGAPQAFMIKAYTGMHGYGVLDVAISHDNTKFASGGVDKAVFLWDVTTARATRRMQVADKTNALAMNADSTVLLTASYDQTLSLWDLRGAARDPIQILSDFKDSVTSIAQTDSAIIASSVDGCVRTYDLRQGLLQTDRLHQPITCVRTTHDTRCCLSMCLGGTLALTEIASGRLLQQFKGHKHDAYKSEACVASDDVHVVSGDEEGAIVWWKLITGACVHKKLRAHTKAVSTLAYHPSKSLLLSASYDGSVKLFDVPNFA